MKFLKATTTDGQTEYFNLEKILTITPISGDRVKILLGAGLYWTVYKDSIIIWDLSDHDMNGGTSFE